LEEEIDLNLQKLNELEIEVSTPVPDFIIEEKVGDKFEASSENADFHYSQQQQSTNYSKHTKRPAAHNSNPMAEPPAAYRQAVKKVPQPKTAPIFKPDFGRSESTESDNVLESAAIDTSRATSARNGDNRSAPAPLQKQPSYSRRSNRTKVEDEFSDEFDISMDSNSPSQTHSVRRFNANTSTAAQNDRSHGRYSHTGSGSGNEKNQTLVRRFHDDEEEEDCEVPARNSSSNRNSNSNNRSNVNPMANGSSRSSRARAAWN